MDQIPLFVLVYGGGQGVRRAIAEQMGGPRVRRAKMGGVFFWVFFFGGGLFFFFLVDFLGFL